MGILPSAVDYPDDVDLIAPAGRAYQEAPRGGSWLLVVGRLAPAATVERAQDEAQAVAARFAEQYPTHDRGLQVRLAPLQAREMADVAPALRLVVATTGVLLAVVCLNLGGLLLVRAMARQHETAVRLALGASRLTIVRTALLEAFWLTVPGMAVGWVVATQVLDRLRGALAGDVPRLGAVALDARSVVVACGLTAVVTLALAAWPAWHATRRRGMVTAGHVVTDDTSRRWLRQALVAGQMACGALLVVLAVLLGRSLDGMLRAPLGFASRDVITVRYDLDWERPKAEVDALGRRVRDTLHATPGVSEVGLGDRFPLQGGTQSTAVRLFGETDAPSSRANVSIRTVTPGYFRALDVPLLAGALFDGDIDARGTPDAIVVNETFAHRHFGRLDVVGERLAVDWKDTPTRWRTIVGVVGDVRQELRQTMPRDEVFQPWAEGRWPLLHFVVRTDGTPGVRARLARALRDGIRDVPLAQLESLDETIASVSSRERLLTGVMATAAAIAVGLALLGAYGLMAGDVQSRRREIGIRLSLGAEPWRLRWALLRHFGWLALAGAVMGLAASIPAARAVASLLYGVAPVDASAMILAVALLTGATIAVGTWPAWRSVNAQALRALRHE